MAEERQLMLLVAFVPADAHNQLVRLEAHVGPLEGGVPTETEMSDIVFAAKMAYARMMRKRKAAALRFARRKPK